MVISFRRGVRQPALLCVLMALVTLVSACGAALVCPKDGGDPWYTVQTRHFKLRTNLDRDEAKERARSLERSYQVLRHLVGLLLPASAGEFAREPMEIVHLADDQHLDELSGGRVGGYVTYGYGPILIVTREGQTEEDREHTLRHELTHRLLADVTTSIPRWTNEGLARFFETVRLKGKFAQIGRLPRTARRYWTGNSQFVKGFAALRSMEPEDFYNQKTASDNYFGSWQAVHYLSTTSATLQARFRAYVMAMARGQSEADAYAANLAAVPNLPDAIRKHRGRRVVPLLTAPAPPKEHVDVDIERMRDGEVHALLARMSKVTPTATPELQKTNTARVDRELQKSREHDPDYTRIVLSELALQGRTPEKVSALRAHVTDHPDDARALSELVSIELKARVPDNHNPLGAPAEGLAKVRDVIDALARAADTSGPLNQAAWAYALIGETEQGLPLAARSVEREPLCGACWDTYALLQFQGGDPDKAASSQSRAIEASRERGGVSLGMLNRLQFYQAAAEGLRRALEAAG